MFGMLVICMEWIDVVVWGIDGWGQFAWFEVIWDFLTILPAHKIQSILKNTQNFISFWFIDLQRELSTINYFSFIYFPHIWLPIKVSTAVMHNCRNQTIKKP
jgi:hypothetical protein